MVTQVPQEGLEKNPSIRAAKAAAQIGAAVPPLIEVYKYQAFRAEVRQALEDFITRPDPDRILADHLLNGAASEALSRHVSRHVRSKYGMFFSGAKLASAAANLLKTRLEQGATIADPACGAGDLLLACLRHAPAQESFDATVAAWGELAYGLDIHSEIASVAKERIALLAATRTSCLGVTASKLAYAIDNYLPNVLTADYLHAPVFTALADCVVMNPPFVEVDTPHGCRWSSGKVQQAALFIEAVANTAKNSQEIVAILPDVLRSGSRYDRWRAAINSQLEILRIDVHGQFDSAADVDVFMLHARKRGSQVVPVRAWGRESPSCEPAGIVWRLGDRVDVSVGSVVPHRHKNRGHWAPFLDVLAAPRYGEVSDDALKRKRHNGKLHQAPFIAIRRTSSPSDVRRVVHSVVTGSRPIAVENHLIVLRPQDGTIEACRALARALDDDRVNEWLNAEIRCRHLTTRVLKDLPVWMPQ